MEENQDTNEPGMCLRSNLEGLSKNKKILLISVDKENEDFGKKISDELTSKDLEVHILNRNGPCETADDLGLKEKQGAVLLEDGKVTSKLDLTNNNVKDTLAISNMIPKNQDSDTCRGDFNTDVKNWNIELEQSKSCARERANIKKLGRDVNEYLNDHVKTSQNTAEET